MKIRGESFIANLPLLKYFYYLYHHKIITAVFFYIAMRSGRMNKIIRPLMLFVFLLIQLIHRQRQKHVISLTSTHHIFSLLPEEGPDF